MRTLGEVQWDIVRCNSCYCRRSISGCDKPCSECKFLSYSENYDRLLAERTEVTDDLEYRHDVITGIPTDDLEVICAAWKEKRLTIITPEQKKLSEELKDYSVHGGQNNAWF